MIVFFDTETSGLIDFRLPIDHPSQPHIVQLAAVLCDNNLDCTIEETYIAIVKPDGWYVQDDAFNVHGISTQQAWKFGEELRTVMEHFAYIVEQAEGDIADPGRLVGHNVEFDIRMVLRAGYSLPNFDASFISQLTPFCTMRAMTSMCRLPHPRILRKFKWPRLEEAYRFLFDKAPDGAHSALGDALACRDVFVEGRKREWWR